MDKYKAEFEAPETPGRTSDSSMEVGDVAQGALHDVLGRLETFVRTRPGVALMAALGTGFIFGRLVRR